MSTALFTVLVLVTGVERLNELRVSTQNAAWAFARGGVESGREHFPWMVGLHTALLGGALAETWALHRRFKPAVGWPLLVVALLCQAGRMWIVATLGRQWNSRIIVVPGLPRVRRGPYRCRWLPHPNYIIVAVEGVALPLVHGAWITGAVFTALNALLLIRFRIPAENRALGALSDQMERATLRRPRTSQGGKKNTLAGVELGW